MPHYWTMAATAAVLLALPTWRIARADETNTDEEVSNDEKIVNLIGLRTRYNNFVRPPPDYNTTNVVYFNFLVLKLLSIDEVGQHMFLEGFTEMEWTDRRLAWMDKNNSIYSNVSLIYLPRTSIWVPDVMTINTVEYKESRQSQMSTVIVMSDGRVFTSSPFGMKTLCDINMLYFPFDSQTCKVIFGSWLMLKDDLELKLLNRNTSAIASDTDRQISIESDEYCIIRSEFAVTPLNDLGSNQEAVFTISVQRKPLFYVMNLIIPSFLILVISVFSYFVPPECGERLSLNITLMLSLMVFMQIVAGYTPAQSDSVPMLTRFFASVVAITAVSTIGSVFQLYCHFKGRACHTVDSAAIRFALLLTAAGGPDDGGSLKTGNPAGVAEEDAIRSPVDVDQRRRAAESEWHTVGNRLDCAVFVAMVIATCALALFIGLIRNPDYVAC